MIWGLLLLAAGTLGLAAAPAVAEPGTAGVSAAAPDGAAGAGSEATSAAAEPGRDEVLLRRRATAYWEARVARSPEVFDFYPPPEARGDLGGQPLAEGGNMQFTAFEIRAIDVEGDAATVQVAVEARVLLTRASGPAEIFREALVREAWERLDGTWYKQPVAAGLGVSAAPPAAGPDAEAPEPAPAPAAPAAAPDEAQEGEGP